MGSVESADSERNGCAPDTERIEFLMAKLRKIREVQLRNGEVDEHGLDGLDDDDNQNAALKQHTLDPLHDVRTCADNDAQVDDSERERRLSEATNSSQPARSGWTAATSAVSTAVSTPVEPIDKTRSMQLADGADRQDRQDRQVNLDQLERHVQQQSKLITALEGRTGGINALSQKMVRMETRIEKILQGLDDFREQMSQIQTVLNSPS